MHSGSVCFGDDSTLQNAPKRTQAHRNTRCGWGAYSLRSLEELKRSRTRTRTVMATIVPCSERAVVPSLGVLARRQRRGRDANSRGSRQRCAGACHCPAVHTHVRVRATWRAADSDRAVGAASMRVARLGDRRRVPSAKA
ncbi:hypothetical protein FKP32DRAFT_1106500 [Trametes sanguinea]|nr:hypothetical protein FKP32DRAFT_1106500 [Trametes sanguinea]